MRFAIFEAVSAGAVESPTEELQAEGLMMLAAIVDDTLQWLDKSPSAEFKSCCDLWLHDFESLKSRSPSSHQVDVLWSDPGVRGVGEQATQIAPSQPLFLAALSNSQAWKKHANVKIPPAASPQLVCFDPLSGNEVGRMQPTPGNRQNHAQFDQVPSAGKWIAPRLQELEAENPLAQRTRQLPLNLSLIPISDSANLPRQWRDAVAKADVAILVAPQPTMQCWMAMLGPLANRVWGVPTSLLSMMEDKRHLTSVPSCVISKSNWNSESTATRGTSHNLEANWFHQHLANATTWAVKPTDQCGGSDVWKIRLANPISDWDTAIELIRYLRQNLSCETSSNQTLLLSPWIEGTPCSLSMIANRQGWWCLPVCQQILNHRPMYVPQAVQHLVHEIHGISYDGSCFGKPLTSPALRSLVWDQFASRLSEQQRPSIRGWIGIDFVAGLQENPTLVEVNPRITSSYNLLRQMQWNSL